MNKKTLILSGAALVVMGVAAIAFINVRVAKHPTGVGKAAIANIEETSQDVKKADLAFEKSGKVVFVAKKVGDSIKAGEVLAKIDNADALVQYNQAGAGVTVAEANLAGLKNSLSAAKLKKKELSSTDKKIQEKQVSLVENNIKAQEAVLIQAQQAFLNAKNQLDKYAVKAPFDGVITVQNIEVGEVAASNVPVISIRAK
jgi:multidrug efflux pump subunit AcrA (membrane-fusion protein)